MQGSDEAANVRQGQRFERRFLRALEQHLDIAPISVHRVRGEAPLVRKVRKIGLDRGACARVLIGWNVLRSHLFAAEARQEAPP